MFEILKINYFCTIFVEVYFYVMIVSCRREMGSKFSHSTTLDVARRGSSFSPFSGSSSSALCLEHSMQSKYFWWTSKLLASWILLGRSLLHVSGRKKAATDPSKLIAPNIRRGNAVWYFAYNILEYMSDNR